MDRDIPAKREYQKILPRTSEGKMAVPPLATGSGSVSKSDPPFAHGQKKRSASDIFREATHLQEALPTVPFWANKMPPVSPGPDSPFQGCRCTGNDAPQKQWGQAASTILVKVDLLRDDGGGYLHH
jgi:hypothetical protein